MLRSHFYFWMQVLILVSIKDVRSEECRTTDALKKVVILSDDGMFYKLKFTPQSQAISKEDTKPGSYVRYVTKTGAISGIYKDENAHFVFIQDLESRRFTQIAKSDLVPSAGTKPLPEKPLRPSHPPIEPPYPFNPLPRVPNEPRNELEARVILDLSPKATEEDARKRIRLLRIKYHHDAWTHKPVPDSEKQKAEGWLKAVNRAYDLLFPKAQDSGRMNPWDQKR